MSSEKTRAFILKMVPYGEADLILTCLTENNEKISFFASKARRSQKRFGGALDYFQLVDLIYQPKKNNSLIRLDEALLVESFPKIREDFLRMTIASVVCEMVLVFTPEGSSFSGVFDELRHSLKMIETQPPLKTLILLEHHWLGVFGLRPVLNRCLQCQKSISPNHTYSFFNEKGGVVGSCCVANANKLSFEILDKFMRQDYDISNNEIKQLRYIFESMIEYQAEKPILSLQTLKKIEV